MKSEPPRSGKKISILNDVLGPVMRGPSSSHTAGSYRIGRIARDLLGENPVQGRIIFDPGGSYAQVYRQQKVDLALMAGLMQWTLTDSRFLQAPVFIKKAGIQLEFTIESIPGADHPNTVVLILKGKGKHSLELTARSTGGGDIEILRCDQWPVRLNGRYYEYLLETRRQPDSLFNAAFTGGGVKPDFSVLNRRNRWLLRFTTPDPLSGHKLQRLRHRPEVNRIYTCEPVFRVIRGSALFSDTGGLVKAAEEQERSMGSLARSAEASLLGISPAALDREMKERLVVMFRSVEDGMVNENIRMRLLNPFAHRIFQAENQGKLPVGGIHTRSAARALAVMHSCNSGGVVCAAPTGGSAGVLPGVLFSLAKDLRIPLPEILRGLYAAGAVGQAVARRATFAAEVAGCQVEIGAAGAMASAAVVEIAGGAPRTCADAAAISFQNTMGSVCDLVQGTCEIPCHTRNAVAASSALVCADLVTGGYQNPIPLDETIDAVLAVGKVIPQELKVTSLGGLATTPSARNLKPLEPGDHR